MNEPVDPVKLKLDYAWAWFSYHAGQRFAAFNFFVVAIGALAVAYADAATHRSDVLGAGVASFGGFLAFALLMIDVRNKQLVDYGQDVLRELEKDPYLGIAIASSAHQRRCLPITHSFWFRAILVVSVGLSIAAAVWAANGFRAL